MTEKLDPFSDHPLFRALVLMGGGLALGCGGTVSIDSGPGGDPALVSGMGGSGGSAGGTAITAGFGGASGSNSTLPSMPVCPYAQWDCSNAPVTHCSLSVGPQALPPGCFCNLNRPMSANDCQASESLLCIQGYTADHIETTWDGYVHVQCSCVPTPPPGQDGATAACSSAFPSINLYSVAAYLPPGTTCNASGTVCTATSADILRQDGIMCGCAEVGLK